MKNKRIKRLINFSLIIGLIIILLNIICFIRLNGKYFTSYYGETTTYTFKNGKLNTDKGNYKYFTFFRKINIFNDNYNYKINKDSLCLYKYKEEYKCFYKNKKTAYEKDEFYYESNTYYKTLADKDGWYIKGNDLIAYYGEQKEVIIPANVKTIKATAFSSDFDRGTKVEKVTIPSNVETIETSSFSFTNAKKIIIEEGIKEIQRLAFANSQIEIIELPKSINIIGFGILDTNEGQKNLEIKCIKNTYACNYFLENMPKGNVKITMK